MTIASTASPLPSTPARETAPSFLEVWNEVLAPKFERFRPQLVRNAAAHGAVALERFPIAPGARVLDVGCGWGDSCVDLARRVGPLGRVVGIDCTRDFADAARRRARDEGLSQVEIVTADAQLHRFEERFDVAFARFGTMFFESPVAAMRNVARALEPGGRMLMCVWRTRGDNPWLDAAKAVALRHLPPPTDQAATCGPGPFSMASPETVRAILGAAGFEDVALERVDLPYWCGDTVDEALAMNLAIGACGETVREAGPMAAEKREALDHDLREMLGGYLTDRGVIMPSSSWAVTATKR